MQHRRTMPKIRTNKFRLWPRLISFNEPKRVHVTCFFIMLESIRLINFQCHTRKSVRLGKITTIVGPNGAGKSAIIRGLIWGLTNAGSKSFIKYGAKNTAVRIVVSDHEIIRRFGKGDAYSLDGKGFNAVGRDVPDEIAELLNLGPATIQRQQDGAFWFGDSARSVSQQLNNIINLQSIDTSLAAADAHIRELKAEEKVISGQLDEHETNIADLAWVPKCLKDHSEIERQEKKTRKAKKHRDGLKDLIREIEDIPEPVKGYGAALNELIETTIKSQDAFARANELRILIESIEKVETEQCRANKKIKKYKSEIASQPICPKCGQAV